MTATMTATKALEVIKSDPEKLDTKKPQRFPEAASPGNFFRQGDLYITVIKSIPGDAVKSAVRLQVADGNTQGSRHCLDAKTGVEMFSKARQTQLDGPMIRLRKERTITHPEHGHVILPPGCYEITYQRNLDSEEREQRVRD